MIIRSVTVDDSQNILDIYSPYIVNSPVSFETEVPLVVEMQNRIKEYTKKLPWIVAEIDGSVVGYAYASEHRSRCAYAWSVETSVYIHPNHQRKGFGKILYKELFKLLKNQGVVNIFAGITHPHDASIALHQSLGFQHIGTYKDVGYKINQWWDVGWYQLQLQKPIKPLPLKEVCRSFLTEY